VGAREFSLLHAFRSSLRPAQPPLQCAPKDPSAGVKRLGLATNLHLVSRSRIVEVYLHSSIRLHGVGLNAFRANRTSPEEWCLLGCYTVWLLQEPHGVTSQKTPFFIVTAVKTSNLTEFQLSLLRS
jgi:hypothetical protein